MAVTSVFETEMAKQNDLIQSPDGRIRAKVVAGAVNGIEFSPHTYKRYTEPELENQLIQLSRLAIISRVRARRNAIEAALGHPDRTIEKRSIESSKERERREATAKESIQVKSDRIRIAVMGGSKWSVQIKQGTIKAYSEEQFLREFSMLVKNAIQTWSTRVNTIRTRTMGPSQIMVGLRYMNKK